MRKSARTVLVLAALSMLPVSARATTCGSGGWLGGSTFATCGSVVISAAQGQPGHTVITMTINNMSGPGTGTYAGTIFTEAGFFGVGNFAYVPGSLHVTSGSGSWALGTSGLSGAGISPHVVGVQSTGSVNNGLHAGQSVTLTFEITGLTVAQVNAAADDWAIHGQAGYNSCSTKLVVRNGTANNGPYDPNCIEPSIDGGGDGSSVVTPEPASLMLVGSGLFGIVGIVRRRRKL